LNKKVRNNIKEAVKQHAGTIRNGKKRRAKDKRTKRKATKAPKRKIPLLHVTPLSIGGARERE